MSGVGRFLLWDVKRASWQYDVIVGLILAFIFLTPRAVFSDQPNSTSIVMLPAGQGYLLEPSLLVDVPEENQAAEATDLVRGKFKTRVRVTRVDPVYDEDELTGFIASTRPAE